MSASLIFNESLYKKINQKYNSQASNRVKDWQVLMEQIKSEAADDKLYAVNKFFNGVDFKSDFIVWGKQDYWATPIEFLGVNAGDCEDYTIAKYLTLLNLGVPNEKLRFMYVTATNPKQAHMVLAYYEHPDSVPLVLDNLNPRILPASQRSDLVPIYSFNGNGLWVAKHQGRGRKMRDVNNNQLWRDLHRRLEEELL